MTSLPDRFPRASLLAQAAQLETRINKLMDQALVSANACSQMGLPLQATKHTERLAKLDKARAFANETRLALWDLK